MQVPGIGVDRLARDRGMTASMLGDGCLPERIHASETKKVAASVVKPQQRNQKILLRYQRHQFERTLYRAL